MNPAVNLRADWSLRCHPQAARWFQQHLIFDVDQRRELDNFIALSCPGMVLFDIGAHFGVFTLAALHYGGESARAVALDPSPTAARMVRTQLAINHYSTQRCRVIETAVGDHVGQTNLVATGPFSGGYYVPSSARHGASDLSSTALTTVDRLGEELGLSPTHLKVDVEGAEAMVIRGAMQTLTVPTPPILCLELHNKIVRDTGGDPGNILRSLAELGYAFFDTGNVPLAASDVLKHDLIRITARKARPICSEFDFTKFNMTSLTPDVLTAQNLPRSLLIKVFLFYGCFLGLTTSGRLASSDAGNQLQAAILLATTGKLGTVHPPASSLWISNQKGEYFECHDIGNIALMFPAAVLGSRLSTDTAAEQFNNPPIVARVGTSLIYTSLCTLAASAMFLLFGHTQNTLVSFLLSFAFVTTTIFWPYAKSAWDVLGACCGVSFLLYFSACILTNNRKWQAVIGMAISLTLACSFRYSTAPFLFLAVGITLVFVRRELKLRHYLAGALVVFAGMLPTFLYNEIRMGSFIYPATTAPVGVSAGTADLHGDLLKGLYGLLASPNRGLLIFSPIFGLLVFLPAAWQHFSITARRLSIAYGVAGAGYLLFIAQLRSWGTFGWGPRYMVPMLPILFYLVANIVAIYWRAYKPPLVILLAASAMLCLTPVLVNWPLAVAVSTDPTNQFATRPYQHAAAWNELFLGLQGKPLPSGNYGTDDPLRLVGAKFPDLLLAHLMQTSFVGMIVGGSTLFVLVVASMWLFQRIIQDTQAQAVHLPQPAQDLED